MCKARSRLQHRSTSARSRLAVASAIGPRSATCRRHRIGCHHAVAVLRSPTGFLRSFVISIPSLSAHSRRTARAHPAVCRTLRRSFCMYAPQWRRTRRTVLAGQRHHRNQGRCVRVRAARSASTRSRSRRVRSLRRPQPCCTATRDCEAIGFVANQVGFELVCRDGPGQRRVALLRCGDGGQAAPRRNRRSAGSVEWRSG